MDSLSSWAPHANSHFPPPIAQAPIPTGEILKLLCPSIRNVISSLLYLRNGSGVPDPYERIACIGSSGAASASLANTGPIRRSVLERPLARALHPSGQLGCEPRAH